ncbi:hypothetical protein BUALT_Bualt03G0192800 [Buddleja alternifolia]|uniref:Multi antimicrobial extrusion protein n=1 Tax=Buddleja alternifolia TaxID=168488 RepID=A0AAV6XWE0_9LAMI|nr:hypothetical protein BUALT_Bualt03G0192800 [Buddleja alternifolia]
MITVYLAAIALSIHVFLSWLLTMKFKFGINGAMISTVLAFWLPNVGQLIFVTLGGCPQKWRGFSSLAFKDLWPIFKLSVSAGSMLCLEVLYNTVLLLLTGNMKNAEVAIDALSICVRIANELGSGNSKAAKFSIATIVITSFTIRFVLFAFFHFFRGRVAIGSGWQSTVAYVNVASYYLVGVPIGIVLGYVYNLQVEGVWIGMLTGVVVQTIALVINYNNLQNRLGETSIHCPKTS